MSTDSSPSEPQPEPQKSTPPDLSGPRLAVTTYSYDARGRLTEIQTPGEGGCDAIYRFDPPIPCPVAHQWGHLADKRLYALTAEGKTEYWRDNPTRYLVVEPDAESGMMKPALKHGRPVYLWLCREERETR
jgi:hypothetical protein